MGSEAGNKFPSGKYDGKFIKKAWADDLLINPTLLGILTHRAKGCQF